jgi:hypothetical protein
MTSRIRSITVAASVAALALAGSMAAYAVTDRDSSDDTISACVNVKTGVMRLEKPSARCVTEGRRAVRERRVSWNKQGAEGSQILTGDGPPSDDLGAPGDLYFDTIGRQIYGPKTTTWPTEGTSLIGEPGPAGAAGAPGPSGAPGPTGPVGSGGGVLLASSGGGGESYQTVNPGQVLGLPLSGVASAVNQQPQMDATKFTAGLMQAMPADLALQTITARFTVGDEGLTFGAPAHLTAQLWTGPANSSELNRVPGASCSVTLAAGTHLSATAFSCNAPLDVDLAAGTVASIGIEIDSGSFRGTFSTALAFSTG